MMVMRHEFESEHIIKRHEDGIALLASPDYLRRSLLSKHVKSYIIHQKLLCGVLIRRFPTNTVVLDLTVHVPTKP